MTYFSKIVMREDAPVGRIAQVVRDNAYLDHKALWRLFTGQGAPAPRTFLFHRIEGAVAPAFYVLSAEPPAVASDLWHARTKEFAPRITQGMRLRFALRANPVVTQTDDAKRHLRRDVVMVRKHALKRDGVPREGWPSMNVMVQEECGKWLQARAARCGFALAPRAGSPAPYEMQLETSGYRQHEFHTRGRAPIKVTTVDFDGVLEVTDATAFLASLSSGIGPAKGFGCGLLLIKRARILHEA